MPGRKHGESVNVLVNKASLRARAQELRREVGDLRLEEDRERDEVARLSRGEDPAVARVGLEHIEKDTHF